MLIFFPQLDGLQLDQSAPSSSSLDVHAYLQRPQRPASHERVQLRRGLWSFTSTSRLYAVRCLASFLRSFSACSTRSECLATAGQCSFSSHSSLLPQSSSGERVSSTRGSRSLDARITESAFTVSDMLMLTCDSFQALCARRGCVFPSLVSAPFCLGVGLREAFLSPFVGAVTVLEAVLILFLIVQPSTVPDGSHFIVVDGFGNCVHTSPFSVRACSLDARAGYVLTSDEPRAVYLCEHICGDRAASARLPSLARVSVSL
ncbi:hypothetical protein EXIGLDRAFT_149541 [Exidia glandulosa HHB12029]|uniref:Transmembrane protein n=1 Tax=Exidia glandulosa HHB12029 TaxID=1314781 RepID=A0A165FMK2_EXIGL|nr:hypothetical protein EXIGLDRAFT_149541 [Exidia glandulosa HHB12029]